MKEIILQCPHCREVITWNRKDKPEGPGSCVCGAWAPWKALKSMPEPNDGYVIVMSSKGHQRLYPPSFRENPNGWIKDSE
jgi:hypothetical protein